MTAYLLHPLRPSCFYTLRSQHRASVSMWQSFQYITPCALFDSGRSLWISCPLAELETLLQDWGTSAPGVEFCTPGLSVFPLELSPGSNLHWLCLTPQMFLPGFNVSLNSANVTWISGGRIDRIVWVCVAHCTKAKNLHLLLHPLLPLASPPLSCGPWKIAEKEMSSFDWKRFSTPALFGWLLTQQFNLDSVANGLENCHPPIWECVLFSVDFCMCSSQESTPRQNISSCLLSSAFLSWFDPQQL